MKNNLKKNVLESTERKQVCVQLRGTVNKCVCSCVCPDKHRHKTTPTLTSRTVKVMKTSHTKIYKLKQENEQTQ